MRNKAARANNANGLAFPSKVVYFQIRVHWRDSRVSLFSTRLGSTRRFEVEDFAKQILAQTAFGTAAECYRLPQLRDGPQKLHRDGRSDRGMRVVIDELEVFELEVLDVLYFGI